MVLLNNVYKKLIIQLEKHINGNFPEYQAKFYSDQRTNYIHMGLYKSLFGYANFKKLLDEVDYFLSEYFPHKFVSIFQPKLTIQQSGNKVI